MSNNNSTCLLPTSPPEAPSPRGVYARLAQQEAMLDIQQARIALLEAQVSALQAQLDQRSARTRMRP